MTISDSVVAYTNLTTAGEKGEPSLPPPPSPPAARPALCNGAGMNADIENTFYLVSLVGGRRSKQISKSVVFVPSLVKWRLFVFAVEVRTFTLERFSLSTSPLSPLLRTQTPSSLMWHRGPSGLLVQGKDVVSVQHRYLHTF